MSDYIKEMIESALHKMLDNALEVIRVTGYANEVYPYLEAMHEAINKVSEGEDNNGV